MSGRISSTYYTLSYFIYMIHITLLPFKAQWILLPLLLSLIFKGGDNMAIYPKCAGGKKSGSKKGGKKKGGKKPC